MGNRSFYNSDGDLLIVPQRIPLLIQTEFGFLEVPPLHIAVIQRGMKFSVNFSASSGVSLSTPAFGYICETFKGHFELPDLGPIGANGLANPEDFEIPTAHYDFPSASAGSTEFTVVNKFMGRFFAYTQPHSSYDVVAFSEQLYPSIFTVLTCPTDTPGTAVCDFVIFPPRYLVAENTFRPPYFHRNCMSEFMGNIVGVYDAKAEGFVPGGASLHNMNSAHGPGAETFEKASNADLKPHKVGDGSMSFMFESVYQLATTKYAIEESGKIQQDYWKAWTGLKANFTE